MDNSKQPGHTGNDDVAVVSSGNYAAPNHSKKWLILGAVLVVLIAVGVVVLLTHGSKTSPYAAEHLDLQKNLADDQRQMYNAGILNVSSQLIDGQKQGNFKIDDKTLATYYMYRGGAYVNTKQYALAMQDYQEAIKLDGSVKEGALQGEVFAGYQAGERQQLIPLLQQLVTISSAPGHDPISGNPQEYKADIQAIQNNQPASL